MVFSDFIEAHDSVNHYLKIALEEMGPEGFERMVELIPQMEGYLHQPVPILK